jgi:hypothetical protein
VVALDSRVRQARSLAEDDNGRPRASDGAWRHRERMVSALVGAIRVQCVEAERSMQLEPTCIQAIDVDWNAGEQSTGSLRSQFVPNNEPDPAER